MAKRRARTKWKPAPPELVHAFEQPVKDLAGLELRKMFGYPAAFSSGNMLAGLFADRMMLRFSPEDLASFRAETGAELFEPIPGRVMRQYAVVHPSVLGSKAQLRTWLGKALIYVRSLPPKTPKARRGK